jgi:SAM-dependent methyltransferase
MTRGPDRAASYDAIADWYEQQFLTARRGADGLPVDDALGIDRALVDLLGPGREVCVELGCGTGVNAARLRLLGWEPVGMDLSARMLSYARGRLPTVRADVARLPVRTGSVAAVAAVMISTDVPDYPAVLREAARILRPGGRLVHIGVHPCFCGGFADRTDPAAIVIRPGYRDGHWTTASWTTEGVRNRVGATHLPLPALLHAVIDAGLVIERVSEGGTPTPTVLSLRAGKPA